MNIIDSQNFSNSWTSINWCNEIGLQWLVLKILVKQEEN